MNRLAGLKFYPQTRDEMYAVLRALKQFKTPDLLSGNAVFDGILDSMEAYKPIDLQPLRAACNGSDCMVSVPDSFRVRISTPDITITLFYAMGVWMITLNRFELPATCVTYLEPLKLLTNSRFSIRFPVGRGALTTDVPLAEAIRRLSV